MKKLIVAIWAIFQTLQIYSQNNNTKPGNPTPAAPVAVQNGTAANSTKNPQDNSNNPPYLKQKKEEITIEGILQLQIMDNPLGIIFNELKVRYFVSEKRAYRARGIASMSNNNITINGTNGKNANVIESKQNLNLGIGFEDHFKSKNHISPYWGAELLIGLASIKLDGSNTDDGTTFKEDYRVLSENTEVLFYIGGVAGLDYYLSSNFYIGTEIRYGYQSKNLGNVSRTVFSPTGGSSNSGNSLGTNTYLGMSYTPGLRIGFKF